MQLSLGNLSKTRKIITVVFIILVLLSIPIAVFLVQQRQEIRKKAIETGEGKLVCDSGPNPYDSNTIVVTNNYPSPIPRLISNVFRCQYSPGRVVEGFYSCETQTECDKKAADGNTHCQVGVWDQESSVITDINPGETKTFTVTVEPCQIAQIDVYNELEQGESDNECYNIGSQKTNPLPPNWWPGGIAFGIKQNPEGYNETTGTCPAPTPTNTPTPTPSPTVTGTPPPTNTPTPTGTPPVGSPPTNTPTPTRTPTPIPTSTPTKTPTPIATNTPIPTATPKPPPGSTPTPTSAPPVSGTSLPTILTIAGGLILVVAALLL